MSFYHSLHFTFAFGLYKGHYTYPMVAQFSTGILAHFSISIYISEKQKRGILIAMLVFTCVASGIVLLRAAGRLKPARERMELPFGEGSLSDTLRRLPDPLRGQETNIYRTIKQPQQNGKQEE
ncbi:hypothetical protein NXU96_20425 [Phocaeicola vulgatus]|nr:hypothetical protein [Phocaeicola vulgatus]